MKSGNTGLVLEIGDARVDRGECIANIHFSSNPLTPAIRQKLKNCSVAVVVVVFGLLSLPQGRA